MPGLVTIGGITESEQCNSCRTMLSAVEQQGKGRLSLKTNNTVEIEGETRPALIVETLALLLTNA